MASFKASKDSKITAAEKAHMEVSRTLAGECPVLLKNDGVLPLKNKKIAAYGRGVRQTIKGGTGSGDVNSRFVVTVEEGLKEAGYTILTNDWIEKNSIFYDEEKRKYMAWLNEQSAKLGVPSFLLAFGSPFKEPADLLIDPSELKSETDTAIYVISRNSGEGADRKNESGDYKFYEDELTNIRRISDFYKNTVLILNIGGVMDLSPLENIDGLNAVLLMSQLGNIGGYVLADILSGQVNPSGKLVDTWARDYSDYPSSEGFSHNDGDVDDEYYNEGIYVGYRYFDSFKIKPLYPFGFGLSYTDFEIDTVDVEQIGADIRVTADVKNVGDVAGKEVVEIYYSAPDGKLNKPYQDLAAYKKTKELAPGETERLCIDFAIKNMASYCEKCASWVLEAGDYVIRVGNSSHSTRVEAKVILRETVKTAGVKNLFKKDSELTELDTAGTDCGLRKQKDADIAPRTIELDSSCITYVSAEYSTYPRREMSTLITDKLTVADIKAGRCSVEDLVAQLSIEELVDYCVGTMRSGVEAVIGEASALAPGAAGDSSSLLMAERGIKNMILADGPAGLRLKPNFRTDLNGRLLPGGDIFGDAVEPFPEMEEGSYIDYYQYCTAIPIGWALAQSWNEEYLEKAGRVVGEEMEQFGVDLWLAPAMNIHRNPLCGRNFEYYSEDPLVSGMCAAAITKGVQSVPGKGTTIKHFACNNQEDNRMFTNSHVSERALREIYLKGYEICVNSSRPLSVMTSYNLINGVHSACNYDLIQSFLRDECGFDGVVMTDWFASLDTPSIGKSSGKYPISSPIGCIYAGNDLQMPGAASLVDDIVRGVRDGEEILGFKINLADLQFNAANVIRVASKM